MIIVYDFDKTLTYKDTLFGFFLSFSKNPLKIFLYICLMLFAKLKFISNDRLKSGGIKLFLKDKKEEEVKKKAFEYSKKIKTNTIYKEMKFTDRVLIVSASFEEYIKPLFPDNVEIVASKLKYENKIVKGLLFNCYHDKKAEILKEKKILKVDTFFTDSYSDRALAMLSKKIVIVRDNEKIICNKVEEFDEYFNI